MGNIAAAAFADGGGISNFAQQVMLTNFKHGCGHAAFTHTDDGRMRTISLSPYFLANPSETRYLLLCQLSTFITVCWETKAIYSFIRQTGKGL